MKKKSSKSQNKNLIIGLVAALVGITLMCVGYFFVMTNGKIKLEEYNTHSGCLAAFAPECGYCPDDGEVIFEACYVSIPKDKFKLQSI